MRIINAMFGRKKGGIEQAFIDYCQCLADSGNEVTAITFPEAEVIEQIPADKVAIETVTNYGQWDPIATWKLKNMIKKVNPDIIITHGNRAATLFASAGANLLVPVASVAHNYNVKHLLEGDALITTTNDLRKAVIKKGKDHNDVYIIPNMVHVPSQLPNRDFTHKNPPVIGSMGRFVGKKGFETYIEALSILKNKGVKFKALLGGEGPDQAELEAKAKEKNVQDVLTFTGWVENKEQFFKSIDMFIVPSLHEPFGIVVLEAFMNSVPVITTDTEGPIEIARPYYDCLMVKAGDAMSLASSIERLLGDQAFAERLGKQGLNTVISRFDTKVVGQQLNSTLEQIIYKYKEKHHDKLNAAPAMIAEDEKEMA